MNRRSDVVALAVLALLITLLFADLLLGINGLYFRDLLHYYHPAKKVLRDIVLSGEFPYWNPFFHAGQPLAANPEHEVFYPLTWLILLPSFEIGFHLLIVVHLLIAGFAMFALLRSMDVRSGPSLLGAYSFAMGGVVLSCLNLLPILFSLAWMPLTCLFARRLLRDIGREDPEKSPRLRRNFAFAALFLGLQLLVGEPTTVVQTGLLLGLYALSSRPLGRRIAAVALLCVAALLVGAVQILPTLDFFSDTVRAHGLDFEVVNQWSLPPSRLAELIYPNFLGRMTADATQPYWGGFLYPHMDDAFLISIYPGLLITAVAAGGLLSRARGTVLVLVISVVSILLALGENASFLAKALYAMGITRSTRFPEKFIVMAVFALIVFGASALDRMLEGDARIRRRTIGFAVTTTAIAGAMVLVARFSGYAGWFVEFFRVRPTADVPSLLAASTQGWLMAIVRGLLLVLLVVSVARIRRRSWLVLAGLFVLLDLSPLLRDAAARVPAEFYSEPPAAKAFPAERDSFRVFHYADRTRGSATGKAYLQPGSDRPWLSRNALAPMTPAAFGLRTVLERDLDVTSLQSTHDFASSALLLRQLRPRDWLGTIASMSNIRYVGVYVPPDVALAKARGVTRDLQPVRFVEGPRNPRYFFARHLVTIRGREDFISELVTGGHPPQTAFISGNAFVPAEAAVLRTQETNNGARLEVDASGPAFLVMSVTAHKYWRITLDGMETPAVTTNLTYQGIAVPRGRHVVEMAYRNPLIPAGGALSATALLALLLVGRRRTVPTRGPGVFR